jgi:hypothetical protein
MVENIERGRAPMQITAFSPIREVRIHHWSNIICQFSFIERLLGSGKNEN